MDRKHAAAIHGESGRHVEGREHEVHEEQPPDHCRHWLLGLETGQPPGNEEDAGEREAGERSDDGHDELMEGAAGFAADLRDAAEDEERDVLDRDALLQRHDAMGQLMQHD